MALDPELMRLALHEAAHACICTYLGIPVTAVWIEPRQGRGMCEFDHESQSWSPEAALYGSLAGYAAEALVFGDMTGTSDDYSRAKNFAQAIEPKRPKEYLLQASAHVEQILLQQWGGLIALTHVLARHYRLDGQQVRSIIREGMSTATQTPVRSSVVRR